jgi:hypothetical protein
MRLSVKELIVTDRLGIQVDRKHYFCGYDTIDRFISYFYQVDLVKSLNVSSLLEIGVGNKTVTNCLREYGYTLTTCDIDPALGVDYVADIRSLPFADNAFDAVLVYEVLEHLPWGEIPAALRELNRVSKKHVLVSVPYSCAAFEITVYFPLIKRLLNKSFIDLFFLRLPYFFRRQKFDGEHYWEMGKKGYSIQAVRNVLKQHFIIQKEVRPILKPIQYFFILQKIPAE